MLAELAVKEINKSRLNGLKQVSLLDLLRVARAKASAWHEAVCTGFRNTRNLIYTLRAVFDKGTSPRDRVAIYTSISRICGFLCLS